MQFDAHEADRFVLRDGGRLLAEYIYRPTDATIESPRPFAVLRTTEGRPVTGYRPDDHPWHKGLSLALPNVGAHNFWGGPTYVRDEGYVQLSNNGTQRHRAFLASDTPIADAVAGLARIEELLDWEAEGGGAVLSEHRTITARAIDDTAWALTWRSVLTNVTTDALAFGSPTTKGREDAGYGGIFWRGAHDFVGGVIAAPRGQVGEAARGELSPWLAHLSADGTAGVLMLDAGTPAAGRAQPPWFARTAEFAGICPAPFFFEERVLAPGDRLTLAVVVLVGDGDVARLAASAGARLVDDVRAVPGTLRPMEVSA